MPRVRVSNLDKDFEVEEGTTILDACLDHGVEVDHACGGVCACSTCHIWVESGMENLNESEEDEEDRLEDAKGMNLKSRLACQCKLSGDVEITLPPQKGLH